MEKIIITNEQARKRIDIFLAEIFSSYSRGELIRRIKAGEISINKKSVKPSYELREGDAVEILFSAQQEKLQPNDKIPIDIIYEDKDILAIHKPAVLQVHPSTAKETDTMVNGIIAKFLKSFPLPMIQLAERFVRALCIVWTKIRPE